MKIEAQPTLRRLPLYARKRRLIRKIQTSEETPELEESLNCSDNIQARG